jgi:hypothetical protein
MILESEAPTLVIIVPEIIPPSPHFEELLAASCVLLFKPFDPKKELPKLAGQSWVSAIQEYLDTLDTQIQEGQDIEINEAMKQLISYRLQQPIANIVEKKTWQSNKNRDIQVIDWVNILEKYDPGLVNIGGLKKWKSECCWVCSKRATTTEPLKSCSNCKRALYCSRECQVAAYWHHSRSTNDSEYGCIEK